jgi:hypothetical protein
MEIAMRKIILTGAAALVVAALPAVAQDSDTQTDTSANADASAEVGAAPQSDSQAPAPKSADALIEKVAPPPPTTFTTGAGGVVTTYPGNLAPPPVSVLNRDYPVCSRTIQDECQNPGEGGAPGHSRALPYWPGKPASEGGH